MSTKRLFCVLIAVVSLVVTACAPQGAPTPTATSVPDATPVQASVEATTPPTAEAPAEPVAATGETGEAPDQVQIQGMFDVGGHKLYMSCKGDGSPTIVYLHGSITDESFSGASSAVPIQAMLSDRYRFCVYDRRNVGRSDEVPGYWTGATAVADLHALLAAAEVEPPYVLLGASFGGLIAHIYAATYPEEVVGMVLLDSPVPNELELEPLLPEDMRFNHEDDRKHNELLDHFAVYEEAYALEAPDIPVTYLLATPSEWPTMGVPDWDSAILDTIRQYVDGFSPGKWVEVESPHYMEPAVPEVIAQELETLIELVSTAPSASAIEAPPLEAQGPRA